MRFARMLLGGGALDGVRILQPETVRLMATNALPATLKDSSWLPSKGQMGFGIDFATRIASPATPDENSGEIGEFLGRPRVDLVLGRSGERHRRRALNTDDALQHAARAQGIPRRRLLERRHRRRTANGALNWTPHAKPPLEPSAASRLTSGRIGIRRSSGPKIMTTSPRGMCGDRLAVA
jgi:CubicO group peptidase (beta-lactamase class C family)